MTPNPPQKEHTQMKTYRGIIHTDGTHAVTTPSGFRLYLRDADNKPACVDSLDR